MHACERLHVFAANHAFSISPLHASQLQTSSISERGTMGTGRGVRIWTKKQLICSSVIFGYETLNKRKPHSVEGSGGVDEGRERSVRLPGLFLFLVSIRCQTNDAVSRNSTAAEGKREQGGRGRKQRLSVGRSVGRSAVSILILPPEILTAPPPSQLSSTSSKSARVA